jgi:type II secretory pathway pseudopilin PulG
LLETIVTLALSTVIAGAAMVAVAPNLHAAAARSAARQIATDLRATRMKAIAQNARFRVVFDVDAGTYTIEREAGPGNFVTDEGPVTLPTTASIAGVAPGDPLFDTRGGVGAVTTVTVHGDSGPSHTVTVNLLGRIAMT